MNKKKKKVLYFIIAFMLTILVGTAFLVLYMQYQKKAVTASISENEALEEIETDQVKGESANQADRSDVLTGSNPQADTPNGTEKQGELGEIKEIGEIGETSEIDENKDAEKIDNTNKTNESGEVVLAFGGDICFYDAYANMYALSNRGGKIESCISGELLDEMRNADICMVNNEFPYSDRGEPLPEKTYTFRSKPENVHLLADMGVDIVSIANNHAYDYGEEAFLDTLDTLGSSDSKVTYVGGGKNLSEASKAAYFTVNGLKVGYLSATQIERLDNPDTKGATENQPGVMRCFTEKELNNLLAAIEESKKQCDFLVVYMHWGTENTDELDWAQPYQADLISKAGADLIVGSHPHCLQGIDVVNDVPVVYSLGNYWFNSKKLDTALLKVTVSKKGLDSIQIIPALQENCSTSNLTDSEKSRVLNYMQSLSQNVTIEEDGMVNW